ncbi:N-acetyltransferase [Bacillus sp. FJAT-49711]|uniref:GNAT family N-acetyltransferase n=1 Tax=Bacillus sp. FJAT-49711 TaxID=2833585 RepID=UPI001BC953A5|nr:N-acetyltransferase [Bacillus sp. FJAT-49711]MBS4216785.1 N-acetyltransferase [Bacillus sp. FJAT-49711]
MSIRTETINDYKAVYDLNYEAFGSRDDEAKLVEKIRESSRFIPELSIVAEINGEMVGHILLSKANVVKDEEFFEVIVLAPVAVKPSFQKKGVGSGLIREGLKRVKELNYGLVLLIGHPSYYPKFGFKPARPFGLELLQFDVPDDVFMVCELRAGELDLIKGELKYPSAFF